jgi:spore germination cell wall hydrolase CwlJ-like protein
MISIIVAVLALTVHGLGHAEELSPEVKCLAQNIYYEARNEPEEGKVAVGVVTLNRTQDPRFPKSVCGVVHQRTILEKPRKVSEKRIVTREVPRNDLWGKMTGATVSDSHVVIQQIIRWQQVSICQFSWYCLGFSKPRINDVHWDESLIIAQKLLSGGYEDITEKYSNALYFHNMTIRPSWAHEKTLVAKIGGHKFYEER